VPPKKPEASLPAGAGRQAVWRRREARSKKQEARSKKQEEDSPVRLAFFWLLTIVSGPFWLLAADCRQ
jgi:hypothetical protein